MILLLTPRGDLTRRQFSRLAADLRSSLPRGLLVHALKSIIFKDEGLVALWPDQLFLAGFIAHLPLAVVTLRRRV